MCLTGWMPPTRLRACSGRSTAPSSSCHCFPRIGLTWPRRGRELGRALGDSAFAEATVAGTEMGRGAAVDLAVQTLLGIRELPAPSY